MPDVHASVGYLTVTGNLLAALADSDDAGNAPDTKGAIASVTIRPTITDPLVVIADKSVLMLRTLRATVDADGRLVAPADGESTTGTSAQIHLVAPDQASLSEVGWSWVFRFDPADGQGWAAFEVDVTGAPGDSKQIGDEILAGHARTLSRIAAAIAVEGTGTDDALTLDDIPEGTPLGTLVVNTAVTPPTVSLYR